MLDSRKLLFALVVVVALTATPAFAQFAPLSCFAQAAGTPSIRAEGVSELTGDIIITCTGGTPTPANQNLRQVTIQIFTAPVINITSRLQDSSFGGFSEAVLFIDEPVRRRWTCRPCAVRPCSPIRCRSSDPFRPQPLRLRRPRRW